MGTKRVLLVAGCLLVMAVTPALAQDNEEDGDYTALTNKTTKTANATCIDYLNSEHGGYSGDKMNESRQPDEITIGLSKAIRDECQKHPKEPVRKAVADVKDAYAAELADIQRRMKNQDSTLKNNSGT
ncbi:MAG: hypothetical protein ABF646_10665 [Acetobacter papayae]